MRLDARELATVLAALRSWQSQPARSGDYVDIATDGGTFAALSDPEIDALCERLNFDSTEGQGHDDESRRAQIVALARSQLPLDDDLQVDDDADVSDGCEENGAWVTCWGWVSFEGTSLDKTPRTPADPTSAVL